MKTTQNQTRAFLLCTIAALTLSISFAKAQTGDAAEALKNTTPEQRAQFQTGLMKSRLKLDSVQTTKIAAINLKYAKKNDELMKGDERKFKMMRDMMAAQKDKDADLKKVFTDDQYKQYQAMEAEMKEKMKDRAMSGKTGNWLF